jgi:hypothetical protein
LSVEVALIGAVSVTGSMELLNASGSPGRRVTVGPAVSTRERGTLTSEKRPLTTETSGAGVARRFAGAGDTDCHEDAS